MFLCASAEAHKKIEDCLLTMSLDVYKNRSRNKINVGLYASNINY